MLQSQLTNLSHFSLMSLFAGNEFKKHIGEYVPQFSPLFINTICVLFIWSMFVRVNKWVLGAGLPGLINPIKHMICFPYFTGTDKGINYFIKHF